MGGSSAKSLIGSNLASKIAVLIGSVALARILFPEDYGYLVIANLFDGVFNLFSISGFETYYIQQRNISDQEDNRVLGICFWLRVRQSLVLFVVQLLLGIGLLFWDQEIVGYMLMILSINHLLHIPSKPSEAKLSKLLEFKPIAKANFVRDIVGVVVKVGCALLGFGPLSFVIGQVVRVIPRTLMLIRALPSKVSLVRNSPEQKKVEGFARMVFLNTAGAYMTTQADAAIVASFYPKDLLGFYHFSKRQASLPFQMILNPIGSMILSYVNKFKNEPSKLYAKFEATGFLIIAFVLPFMVYVLIDIHDVVDFVFGKKWADSAVMVQLFLLYYIFQFITYPSGYLPTALGKPSIKAKVSFISFGVLALVLLTLAVNGAELIYYAFAFVIFYSIKDIIIGVIGFKILSGEKSFWLFILERIKICSLLILPIVYTLLLKETELWLIWRILIFTVAYFITLGALLKVKLGPLFFNSLDELSLARVKKVFRFLN